MPSIPRSVLDPFAPSAGVETCRWDGASGITPSSGQMRLGYFKALRSETVSGLLIAVGSPGAAATPTLVRFGVYLEAANGDLALAASTPNDTTLLATAVTEYPKAFSAPLALIANRWYAFSSLVVSGAAVPQIAGINGAAAAGAGTGNRHRRAAVVSGQADLPSTIVVGALGLNGQIPYAVLTP